MRLRGSSNNGLAAKSVAAFTLAEVMMCVAVAGITLTGILAGYVQSVSHAGRSEQALATLGFALTQPEQNQSVIGEGQVSPAVIEVIQLPRYR